MQRLLQIAAFRRNLFVGMPVTGAPESEHARSDRQITHRLGDQPSRNENLFLLPDQPLPPDHLPQGTLRPGIFMEAKVQANFFGRGAALAIASAVTLATAGGLQAAGFTADQAEKGQTEYQQQCAQCHGVRLEGTEAPGLLGQDVMGNWDTAGGLYDFISVAMPPAQPGQLGEAAYLNIVAYIMRENGAQPGDEPLVADEDKLAAVSLVAETKDGAAAAAQANQETTIEAGDTNVPQAFTWGKELPQYKQ